MGFNGRKARYEEKSDDTSINQEKGFRRKNRKEDNYFVRYESKLVGYAEAKLNPNI